MQTDGSRRTPIERELFLRSLSVGSVRRGGAVLAALMREIFFPAGSLLFRAGEPSEWIYFLVRGEVQLLSNPPDETQATVFGRRDVVGVLDAIQEKPRIRTAKAVTDVVALAITIDDWLDFLEDNFDIMRRTLIDVAQRLLSLTLQTGWIPPASPEQTDRASRLEERASDVGVQRVTPLVERLILLRDVPMFRRAVVQALAILAKAAEEKHLASGDVLFRQGEPSPGFFVVLRGRVAISRQNPALSAAFGRGTVVGGYTALGAVTQELTATAVTPATVLFVRTEDYFDLMEDHFELARSVASEMAAQQQRLTDRLAMSKPQPLAE